MHNRRNYYRILHVQPDAPVEVIRACYRILMLRLRMHPDLGGDHWNAAMINEAFATLKHPDRRAAYDRTLADPAGRRRPEAEEPPAARSSTASHSTPISCAFCHALHPARDARQPGTMCSSCWSPLYAVVRLTSDTARRALERTPRRMPVDVHVTWPQKEPFTGTSEDISVNGMRLTSETEFAPGERLRIECELCIAVGVVTHRRRETAPNRILWHVGVEFVTLRLRRKRGLLVCADA